MSKDFRYLIVGFLGAVAFAVVLALGWSIWATYQDHWRVNVIWEVLTRPSPQQQTQPSPQPAPKVEPEKESVK